MFQVNYLNKISPKGTALWTENYQVSEKIEDADALLVRSAAMQDFTFPISCWPWPEPVRG